MTKFHPTEWEEILKKKKSIEKKLEGNGEEEDVAESAEEDEGEEALEVWWNLSCVQNFHFAILKLKRAQFANTSI